MTVPKIEVENINHPGKTRLVDAKKYSAMKAAILRHVPVQPPGATLAEIRSKPEPELPTALFPGGVKSGWWFKTVQLDLEAKGVVTRASGSPVRLHKVDR